MDPFSWLATGLFFFFFDTNIIATMKGKQGEIDQFLHGKIPVHARMTEYGKFPVDLNRKKMKYCNQV